MVLLWDRLEPPSNIFCPGDPLNEVCREFILDSGDPYGNGENGENLGLGLSEDSLLSFEPEEF